MPGTRIDVDDIYALVALDLEKVESKLLEKTATNFDFVDTAIHHVIQGGGKRFRPILLLLSARACYEELASPLRDGSSSPPLDSNIHNLAAVIELIHVASLVHDDVIDEAHFRRGKRSVNSKWGNKIAVLVGDYLHTRVFSILISQKAGDKIMSIISNSTTAMCEGEVIQAYRQNDFDISAGDYLKIVKLKTGELIVAACTIGALAVTDNQVLIDAITEYSTNLGVAFQIVDDLLDLVADEEVSGKQPFNDLREGKLTLPMIYIRDKSAEHERRRLKRTFFSDNHSKDDIAWVEKLVKKYNVEGYCLKIAQQYADKAKDALSILRNSKAKLALQQLADYVVYRDR